MPLSTSDILKELLPLHPDSFQEDFVGIYVSVENGRANHAGLITSSKGRLYSCHYDKTQIVFKQSPSSPKSDTIFVKKLEIVDKRLIPSFLSHCQRISEEANPKYGMFYRGEYYQDGQYYTENGLPQLMTCVGFCLNVINGFIEEEKYLEFEDWIPVSEQAEQYFLQFVEKFTEEYPDLDVDELKKSLRRIKPSELMSSAYFTNLPVRKNDTQPVNKILIEKFLAGQSS